MFTSWDKALVALIMAILYLLNMWTGWFGGVTEESIGSIIAILTPIFVWLVPNKQT